MTAAKRCCVNGCDNEGTHSLIASITVERIGLDDSTVDAWICCEHLDRLTGDERPIVYLTVSGYEGEAA